MADQRPEGSEKHISLNFLFTYGWALLIVALLFGILAYLILQIK